jgi:hypothetical protein
MVTATLSSAAGTKPHGKEPWDDVDYYVCESVANGIARGSTDPVPNCFKDETDKALAAIPGL